MSEAAAGAALARVTPTLDYAPFASVDLVIEAAVEDVALKQRIFADLAAACGPAAILSTNTSTIDIELVGARIAGELPRLAGAHFFSPAHIMPLLEIVRTPKTSPQVVLDLLDFSSRIKKTPVVVGNCTGFAVNRVFFPYTQAACLLVDLGLDPYKVDKAVAAFGMPMGPFRLSDLVGADVGLHVGKNFLDAFPERCYPARIIQLLNEHKRLGEKTGAGFYKYDARRRAAPDPALGPVVAASRAAASGLPGGGAAPPRMSPQDVLEFIFFPVVNEGCRVIDEGAQRLPDTARLRAGDQRVVALPLRCIAGAPKCRIIPSYSSL
jgi:enoyl-CoA hydratase/3-hydroxyacyl-CoA dehydrogenase